MNKKYIIAMVIMIILLSSFIYVNHMVGVQSQTSTVKDQGDIKRDGFVRLSSVKVLDVKGETDGNTVILKSRNGDEYVSVFSIPNLGPESSFDFSELSVGNFLDIEGIEFSMNGNRHLTVSLAKVSVDAGTCENGVYERGGISNNYYCNKRTNDFNNFCSDSTQCEGFCLNIDGKGSCSEFKNNFGCTDIFEDGVPVTICVD